MSKVYFSIYHTLYNMFYHVYVINTLLNTHVYVTYYYSDVRARRFVRAITPDASHGVRSTEEYMPLSALTLSSSLGRPENPESKAASLDTLDRPGHSVNEATSPDTPSSELTDSAGARPKLPPRAKLAT